MTTVESIVLQMNEFLEADSFNLNAFQELLITLTELLNVEYPEQTELSLQSRIIFIDFEYYNEGKCKHYTEEKLRYIKEQNFEAAANIRKTERKYLKFIDFRNQCEFKKSTFLQVHQYLIYGYFGSAKNDQQIKNILQVERGFQNLEIDKLLKYLKKGMG